MIENIKSLKIKGKCYKSETTFVLYPKASDRISIIYGRNGSGKSTLAEGIFNSVHTGESDAEVSVSFWDADDNIIDTSENSNIFVFNEDYVDENIKIDKDALGSIVLLGDQVDLQKEIDKCIDEIKSIVNHINQQTEKYEECILPNNPANPDYHYKRIEKELKKSGGWAEADSQIKGNRQKSSVTKETINEICKLSPEASLDALKDEFESTQSLLSKISTASGAYPSIILPISYDERLENKILGLLALKIEEPVLTEREKLILDTIQNGRQYQVEDARESFSNDDIDICPYCYQSVNNSYKQELICSINKVLNKDVDMHKSELKSVLFPCIEFDINQYSDLDSDLTQKIIAQMSKCKKIIDTYLEFIGQKLNNIYTPVNIKAVGLSTAVHKLNDLLKELESKRNEFNDVVKKSQEIKDKLIKINKSIAHFQVKDIYKDYLYQKRNVEAIEKEIKKNNSNLDNKNKQLSALKQKQSNISLAIDNINASLEYVFFSRDRLSIELRDEKYYLKSNGHDVKPKDVSVGERNIIALCYFFTQILSNQEISKLYKTECFVVIDDPISSFDFENKVGISSLVRYQASRIIKGNQKSKILLLSHDLETVFNLRKAMDEVCESTKKNNRKKNTTCDWFELSSFSIQEFKRSHNEYESLLTKVYDYAKGDLHEESVTIGNVMRRVLEAFSTFNYKKSIEKVSQDENVLDSLGERSEFFEFLMYRLVLHGESHYEEQIREIRDGYNFFELISTDEKKKIAKYILVLMYLLNPSHIKAYFGKHSQAIKDIEMWTRAIPKNKETTIIEIHPPQKQKIRLYDLALSAGNGNESLDDIPYEDYETDNDKCNFALKISGNSMEPKIPDNSIVLVRKVDSIDEGRVGAFEHNGKMYCKYLLYKEGKTLLCSYNSDYPPIEVKEDDNIIIYGEVVEIV